MARWAVQVLLLLIPIHVDALGSAIGRASHVEAKQAPTANIVNKVVTLLDKLRTKVSEEGTAEAAMYDKYACFCKDQADKKSYTIAKSDKLIGELDAEINALQGDITQLDLDVVNAKTKIEEEQNKTSDAQAIRDGEHSSYSADRAELVEAIDALMRALDAMRSSKGEVASIGSAAALLATHTVQRFPAMELSAATREFIAKAAVRSSTPSPIPMGGLKSYEYSSDIVITTLMELTRTFKKQLAELDESEGNAQHDHMMTVGAMANTVRALEKEVAKKEQLSVSKNEEKAEKEGLHTEEVEARNADQAFLDDLNQRCEAKASSWDQRSKARADELTVLLQAAELLRNLGLEGSMAMAQIGPHVGNQLHHSMAKSLTSFLQVSSGSQAKEETLLDSVVTFLNQKARALHSAPLALLAVDMGSDVSRASGSRTVTKAPTTDHFFRVRGIIKDLIARLQADAIAEATQKTTCDSAMTDAISKRDTQANEMEKSQALVDQTNAELENLQKELEGLDEEISEAYRQINETKDLREQEQTVNNKTIADAEADKAAVEKAISLLQSYYSSFNGGVTFLQLQTKAPTPDVKNPMDRSGNAVVDLAPEVFETGDYAGATDSATGIIGMLEVIVSDFDRTISRVTAADAQAEIDAENHVSMLQGEIQGKETIKTGTQTDIDNKELDLGGYEADLNTAKTLHEDAIRQLESLKAACVAGPETAEERAAAREREIEALKEALAMFESWQQ